MTAFGSFVKVLVVCAVEPIDTVEHILGRMGMDNIQKNSKSHSVCRVDQLLQILGSTLLSLSDSG
jgi:hypothetical protein